MRRSIVLLLFVVALLFGMPAAAAVAPSGPPTSTGTGGAAASVETLATQAAIDTLKAGGNAIDAAVAAAGVLGVTEPFSCGLGGGGFMVIRTKHGKVITIDGRETAPEAMTPTSFIDPATGQPLPFNDARWSGLSVGVPGTPATWEKALEKYGRCRSRGAAAGIRVARDGFVVDQTFFDQTSGRRLVRRHSRRRGALPRPGRHAARRRHDVQQPDLAHAYERIAHTARRLLPRRDRDAIVDTVQHPPSRRRRTTSGGPA
jgi:gamma-glutamyltranspeptidase/glutathione hydrolase